MAYSDFGGFGFDADDMDEAAFWLEADIILGNIVSAMVNLMGMPIGITLSVKGMMLSGVLVSEVEYLESLSSTFSNMMKQAVQPESKEESEAIDDAFDFGMLAEGYYPPAVLNAAKKGEQGEDGDEDDIEDLDFEDFPMDFDPEDMPPPIRHLHLKDVKVLNSNPGLNFGAGVLPIMRIRLTSVDGWMLGHSETLDEDLPAPPKTPDSDEILH